MEGAQTIGGGGGVIPLGVSGHGAANLLPAEVGQANLLFALLRAELPCLIVQAGCGTVLLEDGAFGADGYYRLGSVVGTLLPLREALREDAPAGRPAAPGVHGTPLGGQQAAVHAVGDGTASAGVGIVPVLQTLVEGHHYLVPQHGGGVFALQAHLVGGLIAHPDGGGVVGGVAHKPAVVVVTGGARLAGGVLALDAQAVGGTAAGEHSLKHVIHIPGSGGFDDLLPLQGVVHQGDLLAVHQLGDFQHGAGALVDAPIGEDGVGLGHVPDVGAVSEAAHGQRGGDIAGPLAPDHAALLQVDVVAVLNKFEALLRGNIVVHQPDRDGVQRLLQALPHGEVALIAGGARVQGPGLASQHLIGVVVQHRVGADLVKLQGRGVDGQGLEGGAGLPVAAPLADGEVAYPVCCLLLSELTADGHQVARLVFDNADGGLHLLAVLGGVVQVVPVAVNLVHDALGAGIIGCVDPQAAPLHGLLSALVGPAQLVRHDVLHLGDDSLLIPGVDLVGVLLALVLYKDQFLSHRRVVLLPADHPLLQHLVEDDLLAVFVPLAGVPDFIRVETPGAGEGVGPVFGRVVGNADKAGALGQGELRNRLAEISHGSRSHPLELAAQGDGVQVVGDGVLLGVVLGKPEGPDNLSDFPLDGGLIIVGLVLNQLLGDGGTAGNLLASEHGDHSPTRPPPVHAGVGPEAPVLDGHSGVNQVFGNLLKVGPHRAGHIEQFGHLHVLPGGLVLVVHDAVLVPDEVVRAEVGNGNDHLIDVNRREAGQQRAGTKANEDKGADGFEDPADHPAHGNAALLFLSPPLFRRVGRLTAPPGGRPARGRLTAGGIVAVLIQRGMFLVIRHDKYLQLVREIRRSSLCSDL